MDAFLNPLVRKYLETAVRDGIKAAGLFMIAKGWITEADLAGSLPGLTLFVTGLLWSLWERRDSLRKINTALSLPQGTTPQQLLETIKRDGAVPASLPLTVHPIMPSRFAATVSESRSGDIDDGA
jgi:hypothetical protein